MLFYYMIVDSAVITVLCNRGCYHHYDCDTIIIPTTIIKLLPLFDITLMRCVTAVLITTV